MKLAIFVLPLALLMSTSESTLQTRDLSRDEAIKLAEAAIVKNGCTDLMPLGDRRKLSSDQPNADIGFLMKHDVSCKAIHALEGKVNGKSSWIIGFWLTNWCPECTGVRHRLVLMNKDGSNLRLESQPSRIKQILKNNR